MKRKIILTILAVLTIVIGNGCYYVFHGQFRSAEKIRLGRDLSLYEVGSIYTMHLAICTVGWLYSPEATKEVLGMSFHANRGRIIEKESDFFLKCPSVAAKVRSLGSPSLKQKIAFDGDVSYMYNSPDRRLALAVNPGYIWKDCERVYLQADAHYPKCYNTHIGLPWGGQVTVNECLFSYLEDKGILHPYSVVYSYPLSGADSILYCDAENNN